ncbi:MAG: hypothetical protein RLZZ172_1814 [Bacteroidota bacterium]|jgi:hypothetical protein
MKITVMTCFPAKWNMDVNACHVYAFDEGV